MVPQEKINQYIADQEEWKRLLLVRIRQLIHQTDERIEENWRWNGPHFDVDGIMLGMAGFKHFVSVWFHKGALLKDKHGLFEPLSREEEKSNRIYKIKQGEELNEAAFIDLVEQSVALNLTGATLTDARPKKKSLVVPPEVIAMLKKDDTAWSHWKKFSHTKKREYVEWITGARQEETRKRRMAKGLELVRENQGLNDNYREQDRPTPDGIGAEQNG